MRLRLGIATVAAAVASLTLTAAAEAFVSLEEQTFTSKGRAFRALVIRDQSGLPNTLVLRPSSVAPEMVLVSDLVADVGPAPPGCSKDIGGDPGAWVLCPRSDYDVFLIDVGGGDDRVDVSIDYPPVKLKKLGTRGNPATVSVQLGPGNDRFSAPRGGGSNLVRGGGGRDEMLGSGKASDILIGGPGRDKLFGRAGRDLLLGGKGRDRLNGGKGVDFMIGGPGRDHCVFRSRRDRDRVGGCEKLSLER